MTACPRCGFEAADDFAFCPKCATALAAPPSTPEARKVVTTLFCDLVAFTAMSEAADPEDVDALLRKYHAAARKVIESHGGSVEKFIGDAVVGVFGVPAVHEDDPERAVRAGLRIVAALEGMSRPDGSPLQVRVGVNTGEALVRLDVTPGSGEGFLTGDAVNVGARIQSAAPPMGVVVGALTHELTSKTIVCEPLEPVVAKGKCEPLDVWLARSAQARTGAELGRDFATAFVGRDKDLARLQDHYSAVVASSSPRFALILGEPGMGKSRLVAEFAGWLDDQPELVTWRQGRCLPYGEGVTFWALAEIVKAHAGVLDTDAPDVAAAKLEAVIPTHVDGRWLANRLRPLLGLETTEASREENFAAWESFLEHLTDGGPGVLVFEDLHWADDAMLAFLDHLAGSVSDVPLFLLATARPALFERHPDFGSSRSIERLALRPLSEGETGCLLAGLLGDHDASGEIGEMIVAHCAGNPLYAEEYARLLAEGGLLRETRGGLRVAEGVALPMPGSIQGVLAARLDTLRPQHKALLADAAVIGDTFWSGGVAAIGKRDKASVEADLEDLAATELIRRLSSSSLSGEQEYAFWHALARDVAYGELTRAARADKHAAAAEWLEGKAGERSEDIADVLAHHYVTALELATATGHDELAASLHRPAVRSLMLAGDRAMALDVTSAERSFARALALAPSEGLERSRLLVRRGDALQQLARFNEAAEALEEGAQGLASTGKRREAAVALTRYQRVINTLGDDRGDSSQAKALALLEDDEPSPELVEVLVRQSGCLSTRLDDGGAIQFAERALSVASTLGLLPPPEALCYLGASLSHQQDARGMIELQRAVDEALAQGLGRGLLVCLGNLCVESLFWEGPRSYARRAREVIQHAQERGQEETVLGQRVLLTDAQFWLGLWDSAMEAVAELKPGMTEADDIWDLLPLHVLELQILLARGRLDESACIGAWFTEVGSSRSVGEIDALLSLVGIAAMLADSGDLRGSRMRLRECLTVPGAEGSYILAQVLPLAVRTAIKCQDRELGSSLSRGLTAFCPFHRHVLSSVGGLLAEADGAHEAAVAGFAVAAAGWHEFGVPYEEAQALLGQGRCVVALGKAGEAREPLSGAREIFERLGAKPALEETEELLAQLVGSTQV